MSEAWLDSIHWDEKGLLPAIVQDAATGEVLMFAWMNREALQRTAETQTAVFWSRSRNALWYKGEQSGHTQRVRELRLDCDQDVILLRVDQLGGIACHTGRKSCFFQRLENGVWQTVLPVLKDPKDIYR